MAGDLPIPLGTLGGEQAPMLFEPIEGKTHFTKAEMITYARRRGFPTNEAQFERWVDYGLIGKGRKEEKGYWSRPQLYLFLKLLEQNRRRDIHPIDLCTIPTWAWLYLGDEADIRIEQVERVMWTWQAMQFQHPAAAKTRAIARKMVEQLASKHPEGKRELMRDLEHFAKELAYRKSEQQDGDPKDDFFYHLGAVIDPQGKSKHNGPQGAALTAQVMSAYFEIDRMAVVALLEKRSLPRRYWTSARNLLLYERAQYQQKQPQFAREVADKPSAELFCQQTVNDLVTAACRDLRLGLGIIMSRPALCDQWEQREVKPQVVTSPLLLPDGTHYRYLQLQGR
jgi:hypothetical protein